MNRKVQMQIPVVWHYTSRVRHEVEQVLRDYPFDLRRAAQMVASELVENAIKYGCSVEGMQEASFLLTLTDQAICIEVSSGVSDSSDLEEVVKLIDEISHVKNKENLLIARMQEMLISPDRQGRLGLYRIVSEGKSQLTYEYQAPILTMRAVRALHE